MHKPHQIERPQMARDEANSSLTSVKPVPVSFRKHGYEFRLVERSKRTAIYSQSRGSKLYAYEAIIIRYQNPHPFMRGSARIGEVFPKVERYPTDRDWGSYGWTYSLFGGKVTAETALAQARAKLVAVMGHDGWQKGLEKLPTIVGHRNQPASHA